MVWFTLSARGAEIAPEHGIDHFFRFWGGESLYLQHMDHPVLGPALRAIGSPCIVEVALSLDQFSHYPPVGYHLLKAFLSRRCDEEHEGWECHVGQPISASQIRRIIRPADPCFETLTRCSAWDTPLDCG